MVTRIREEFPQPFSQIANVIFRPHETLISKASRFIGEQIHHGLRYFMLIEAPLVGHEFKNQKWVSIHARGLYDTGEGTVQTTSH